MLNKKLCAKFEIEAMIAIMRKTKQQVDIYSSFAVAFDIKLITRLKFTLNRG
jgi:hypothetical protein